MIMIIIITIKKYVEGFQSKVWSSARRVAEAVPKVIQIVDLLTFFEDSGELKTGKRKLGKGRPIKLTEYEKLSEKIHVWLFLMPQERAFNKRMSAKMFKTC